MRGLPTVFRNWMEAARQLATAVNANALTTKDEGTTIGTEVNTLNFTGAGVTATHSGSTTTVNVPRATGSITLTASVASSTLTDSLITANSHISLMPTTANAAAEIGNGTMYISARASGSATITHANNAQVDRTFVYSVVG